MSRFTFTIVAAALALTVAPGDDGHRRR